MSPQTPSHEPQKQRWTVVIGAFEGWRFAALAGLCGALATAWMLRDGIIVTIDGWYYWEGSISLLEGNGYTSFSGDPIFRYPALFPLYLSVMQRLFSPNGFGLVAAVVLLGALGVVLGALGSRAVLRPRALVALRRAEAVG